MDRSVLAFLLVLAGCSTTGGAAGPTGARGVLTYGAPDDTVHAYDLGAGSDTPLGDGAQPDRLATGELVLVTEPGVGQPYQIAVADAAGAHPAKLVAPGPVTASLNPTASPDGSLVAFTYYPRGFPHTFAKDDGTAIVDRTGKLVANLAGVFDPAWTPDGRLVLSGTVHTASGNEDAEPTDTPRDAGLFVASADFTKVTRIPVDLRAPMTPAVSPDGTRIAFVQGDDVWTMGIDGTDVRQLTAGEHLDANPTFSPDGSFVALHSLGLYGNSFTIAAVVVVRADLAAPVTLSADSPEALRDASRASDSVAGRITASDRMRWR